MFEPPSARIYRYEWEVTPDGELLRVSGSPDLLRLHGHDPEELASPEGWRSVVAPEDEAAVTEIAESMRRGEPWNGRLPIRTKGGETLILEIHNDIERCPDGRLLIHGVARDVTSEESLERSLREREARLRLLEKNIPIVLWSTDRDLRFTWSSGSGLAALGLQKNDVVGRDLFEFFGTDDPDFPPIAAHRRALAGESVDFDLVWEGREFRCSVEPGLDEEGNVSWAVGVAVDLTVGDDLHHEARDVGRDLAGLSGSRNGQRGEARRVIDLGEVVIDLDARTVSKAGSEVNLTATEFELLAELATHPGRTVERDELLAAVWGYDFVGGSSPLWMMVKRLRDKIEDDPHDPQWIQTVRGVGYRLTPPESLGNG